MTDYSLLISNPPADWEAKTLGDICDVVKHTVQPSATGSRRYVGLGHLVSGLPLFLGSGLEADVRSGKTAFKVDDVLFGKLRPYLRKSVLSVDEGICSTDILVLRARSNCDPRYLCYLTHAEQFISHAKATTTGVQHPRTSWSALRDFSLHLPPLAEQKENSRVLHLVQKAIDEQMRIQLLIGELKQALLQKFFGDDYRASAADRLLEAPVRHFASLKSGGTPSRSRSDFWEGGTIPWVKTSEVNNSVITGTEEHITPAGLSGSSARVFPAGTLLMAMYGQGVTRGKVGVLGIDRSALRCRSGWRRQLAGLGLTRFDGHPR